MSNQFIIDSIEDDVNRLARATALKALTLVVKATPVDTGRAKGNWQTSEGDPETSISDRKGSKGAVEAATINDGNRVLGENKDTEYPVFYLANNLPYIERLNNGYSEQAPAKFVETSVKIAAGVEIKPE